MNRGLLYRTATVLGVVLLAVICLMPNWVQTFPGWWKAVFPTQPIHLGLDLQGGIHMVLEVDADKAVQNAVDLLRDQLRRDLRDEEIATWPESPSRSARALSAAAKPASERNRATTPVASM